LEQLFKRARLAEIDLFDQIQLNGVTAICRNSTTLRDAGRALYAASRAETLSPNDADRLRNYLARFSLSWERVTSTAF
jgi:transcriptional regulatory protein RtcR